ncbi:MAG TPA: transaldolase family protein [Myxococcaceae bacterium]|nr:transaldolase family protein [Myxococcaceae bacterium]
MISDLSLGRVRPLDSTIRASVRSLVQGREQPVPIVSEEERYLSHILDLPLSLEVYGELKGLARAFGVTKTFRSVIDTFQVPAGETPAGFRIEFVLDADAVVRADLVRDISCDRNGRKRATRVLFSADSANPYEVAPIAGMLANLTCNPGIVYDLFINNPKANVGKKFKTRDEVMLEIGRIVGPGVDISVELNNPFEESEQKILEEAEKFREMLTPYRVVIKVPHTGPVNARNVGELLAGDKLFHRRFDAGTTADMLRGHNLALMLRDHGFRINFTLMFEPYQSAMALQAKPYFINSFVRMRLLQTAALAQLVERYRATHDDAYLAKLRTWMVEKDYLAPEEKDLEAGALLGMADRILRYRQYREGFDGLDGVRHNLNVLRTCNLPDTRLIICSMEGETMYPDLDSLLARPELADMTDRVVITAEPGYLARFTSSNQVVSYQRRFMNAAQGQQ